MSPFSYCFNIHDSSCVHRGASGPSNRGIISPANDTHFRQVDERGTTITDMPKPAGAQSIKDPDVPLSWKEITVYPEWGLMA